MTQRQRAALADRYQTDGMAGASPQKLLLAMFDRLQRDLEAAVIAIPGNHIEVAHRALVNAQELVHELRLALDADAWPGANDLRLIYDHLLGLLIDANLNKSVDVIERCLGIVKPLHESWSEAHQRLQQGQEPMPAGGVV